MGTKVAPTYANIFMGYLRDNILLKDWKVTLPHMWRRYIDDIIFFWRSSVEELKEFINHLNQCRPYIKFTAEYDIESKTVPFLDMSVSIKDNHIFTDLYQKATRRVQYSLPSSCHPMHITNNIPFSLGYRILRICSSQDDFMKHLNGLRQDLLS